LGVRSSRTGLWGIRYTSNKVKVTIGTKGGEVGKDRAEGLGDAAQNTLRETTGALRGEGPWHSPNSEVYHNNPNCQTGNSIQPKNVMQGTGSKTLCGECQRLNNAGGRIGNITGL
jgi:hypothetical protein